MIVGRGMIASALHDESHAVLYAAGVSNSQCRDESEFDRDQARLREALKRPGLFVYFSSCAIAQKTPYMEHKAACERMVEDRGDYLICRLPIVAGRTPNPHTLLNYLYQRIARGESLDLWADARRNVIDVADVAAIVRWLIRNGARDETVSVANPVDFAVEDIVKAFEQEMDRTAVVKRLPGGDRYAIDTSRIKGAPVDWTGDYLGDVIRRYYA